MFNHTKLSYNSLPCVFWPELGLHFLTPKKSWAWSWSQGWEMGLELALELGSGKPRSI